jgi:hypothetical protein
LDSGVNAAEKGVVEANSGTKIDLPKRPGHELEIKAILMLRLMTDIKSSRSSLTACS